MSDSFDLSAHGVHVARVLRNPSPPQLYEEALRHEEGSAITATGALVAMSGEKTGRSPTDKRIVRDAATEGDIWWGPVNVEMGAESFATNRERALAFLNGCERLYCIDAFAGWDPKYQIKVRVICARAYHALFMHNMLIRPTAEQLADFGEPDYVILNAGQEAADPSVPDVSSETSVNLSFADKQLVILGTEYAGEMKKGVFTVMNYLMPKIGVLSMHCSATIGAEGDTSILFGLSGTGKTTLSADPKRKLIGDDEHCWTDDGVFNIEGGCYAKVIDISAEEEPDIYRALRFGSVLENVVYDPETRSVDYTDTSLTQNTRGSYPIEYIDNIALPCLGGNPANVIFLTCDAFGVLPPVSKLTPEQAMYHFMSGYTAKVAGTEMGVTEPQATFSPCFGGPFLVWHPAKYAELLADKTREQGANVWLVNTGWSGGGHGVGSRMKLRYTRAIVDAIHNGELAKAETRVDDRFGFEVPQSCPDVPAAVLNPRDTWSDGAAYDAAAAKLGSLFQKNFTKYADHPNYDSLTGGGPKS
jgi:phosphoenolpyruvate carboxykinase (ATP)